MTEREWYEDPADGEVLELLGRTGATEVTIQRRRVHDGVLRVIRTCDPPDYRWRMTIAHEPRKRRARRYPTWDEVIVARMDLLPGNLHMAVDLPAPEDYVLDLATLHLYQHTPQEET